MQLLGAEARLTGARVHALNILRRARRASIDSTTATSTLQPPCLVACSACDIDLDAMNTNDGLRLIAPRITPVLDPAFRPAALAARTFRDLVAASERAVPVRLAIEQADGSVFRFDLDVLPDTHPHAAASVRYLEDSREGNWAHASAALALDRYLASPLEHELDRASR